MIGGPSAVGPEVNRIPLSVLELAPVAAGVDPAEALQYTTELARRVEELGYRRIWVAEHHNMPAIASSSPAVLIAHLAALDLDDPGRFRRRDAAQPRATRRRRAVRHARVIASGTDRSRRRARPGHRPAHSARVAPHAGGAVGRELPERVRRRGADARRRSRRGWPQCRRPSQLPEIWLLGSSGFSAQLAGELGLPFSFAHHFSAANTEPALELYRQSFRPSQWLDAPHTMVAVNAICADTDERAELLARPGWLAFLRLRMGRPIALPSVEDAAAYEFNEVELEFVAQRRVGQALGSPETVRASAHLAHRTHRRGRAHAHQPGL